jgi:hypothetical protein
MVVVVEEEDLPEARDGPDDAQDREGAPDDQSSENRAGACAVPAAAAAAKSLGGGKRHCQQFLSCLTVTQ